MSRIRRSVLTVVVAVVAALTVGGAPGSPGLAAPTSTHGAAGAGDPYYPRQGNGGYDAQHYFIKLRYTPGSQKLIGAVKIWARTTQRLARFDLDLRPDMKALQVTVNARPARFSQPAAAKQELVITPPHLLPAGREFTVYVRYAGTGHNLTDPDGSSDGWIPTSDGAFVADEPQGAPTWFPVNDTPRDKATFTVQVDTPRGLAAISNGKFVRHEQRGPRTIWRWRLDRPVSSYLITATVGHFGLTLGRTPGGVPYVIAVDPKQQPAAGKVLAKLPAIVDYFSRRYGAYPFPQVGAIVDNAPKVGYALETATRPLFDRAPDVLTLAHELAHQWYGDTVTCAYWRDIWLNEGFAEFSSWLWDEHRGGMTAHQHLVQLLARPASSRTWNPPPGNPGSAAEVFADSVYDRGAGVLEALREKLGDGVFFNIMRGWLAAHRYGNATTRGFTRFAAQVAHRDLTHFFNVWLYRTGKP